MQETCEVQDQKIQSLPAVRTTARIPSSFRPVQDLLQANGAERFDTRRGKGELVIFGSSTSKTR
jgi:hypothetical protein